MIRPLNWRQSAGVTLLLLLLATAEIWALNTPMLRAMQVDLLGQNSARDLGILLDLLLMVPLAFLILTLTWRQPAWLYARLTPLLRHSRRLVRSVAWMVLLPLGYAAIRALPLPASTAWLVLGAVELAFLVLLGTRIIRLWRPVRELRGTGHSLVTALLHAAPRGFPSLQLKLALRLVITEFALLTYSVAGWFLPRNRRGIAFSNHRRDDDTVFIAVAFLVCFEAIPVHVLLHNYSAWAAWILTGLSVYTLMWVLGEMAARRYRPTLLSRDWLRVCHGLRGEVVIQLADINSVAPAGEARPEVRVGDDCQLLFSLAAPVTVAGWFGIEKQASEIGVAVDEPERLLDELRLMGVPVSEVAVDPEPVVGLHFPE